MIVGVIIILIVFALGLIIFSYRHQSLLRDRALLMRDAIRHRDFSFRLPTKGLMFGERALQEALNDMGHDIEKLVAHNEVDSWQRLTRVLTHEIMNVMTPIRSISQAFLDDPALKGTQYEEGFRAIHDTSTGLVNFVSNYRKMTQLQEPVLQNFKLSDFFGSLTALYPDMDWIVEVPSDVILRADENLLRQVFVNLVKNAIEAGASVMGIKYSAASEHLAAIPTSSHPGNSASSGSSISPAIDSGPFGKLLISNNGHVIPDDVAREIFIPFFTTKRSGSGIGLSLSRQILLSQGMILRLAEHPAPGYNVTFILEKEKQ